MNSELEQDDLPTRQTADDIREALERHCNEGIPCEVIYDHRERVCSVTCFAASVHEDYVILAAISQDSWLNGWRAMRLAAIRRVSETEDEAFILRAMAATGVSPPVKSPVAFPTLLDFLSGICSEFPIVTTDDDPDRSTGGAAGAILDACQHSVTMHAMSTDGYWEPQPITIELRHITHVIFGGKYERILEQIADLPDA